MCVERIIITTNFSYRHLIENPLSRLRTTDHALQAAIKALEAKAKNSSENTLIFPENKWPEEVAQSLSFNKSVWDF